MKKRERSYLAWSITMSCLLSTVSAHAGGEVTDISGMWPESTEGISYVIDFVDWDGELLDSRICTYGERLEDIIVPGQREEGGHIYRFTGWEPEVSETVTGSMAYMAVYQRSDRSDDGSGGDAAYTVSGPETEETSGLLEKAALGSRSSGKRTHVSSTSYDVTPFHIGSSDERPDLSDEWTDILAEEDPFGPAITEIGVFETTGSKEAEQGMETDAVCIPENMERFQFIDIRKKDMPKMSEMSDLKGISRADLKKADAASKKRAPASRSDTESRGMGAVSVEIVKKTPAVKLKEQEIGELDLVSQKSFPLTHILCSVAVGTWIVKGVRIYALFRKRR